MECQQSSADEDKRASSSSVSIDVPPPSLPQSLKSRPIPPWPISPSSSYASPIPHNRRSCPGAPRKQKKTRSRIFTAEVPDNDDEEERPIHLLPRRRLFFDSDDSETAPTRRIISPYRRGMLGMDLSSSSERENSLDIEHKDVRVNKSKKAEE